MIPIAHRLVSWKAICFLLFLTMLEFGFFPALHLSIATPAFLYLWILYASFQWHWEKTLPLAFGIGLLRDSLSSGVFGLETWTLVFGAICLDFCVQKMQRERLLLRLITTFIFVFSVLTLSLFIGAIYGRFQNGSWFALLDCLAVACATTIFMPVFFFLAGRWFTDRMPLRQFELFSR